MDKSKKYIEMCMKAEEIQERKLQDDDYVFIIWKQENKTNKEVEIYANFRRNIPLSHKIFWLPRQDQLQQMYYEFLQNKYRETTGSDIPIVRLIANTILQFNSFVEKWRKEHYGFDSIEKYSLAFIMKGLYQKTWNRKDWKKVK